MRKKRTTIIVALILAFCMVFGIVSSFGAVAMKNVISIAEGTAGEDIFVDEFPDGPKGYYGRWNNAADAIVAKPDYANRLVRTTDNKSSVQDGAAKEHLAKNDVTFGDHTANASNNFVFNVTNFDGAKNGAIKIRYTGYKIAHPKDDKADGKGYVWVDVVITSMNWTKVDRNEGKNIITIGRTLTGGYPRIQIAGIGELSLQYDYYYAGTNTEYDLKTNATYRDIDGMQGIAFKSNAIEMTAVTPQTNLMYGKSDDWYVFSASSATGDTDNPRNSLGLMYDGQGSRITYISNQGTAANPEYGNPRGGWVVFSPSTYSWFDLEPSEPAKSVSDTDEIEVKENTVGTGNMSWTYNVTQHIPAGINTAYYWKQFVITDKIDTCLEVTDVKIKNQKGADVTDRFTIETSADNVVTAAAKADYLADAAFYGDANGNDFTVEISVKVDETKFEADKDAHGHVVTPDTRFLIKNGETIGDEPTTYSTIQTVSDTYKKPANEVITNIAEGAAPTPGPAGKRVSDDDEPRVISNWLSAPDEGFTYEITQNLPGISPVIDEDTGEETDEMPYYTEFTFTDTLEDLLTPVSAKVMSGGADVSSDFNISISGQTVTASMTGGALNSDSSYGASYVLTIETEINTEEYDTQAELEPWLSGDGLTLIIPNSGSITLTDYDGSTTNAATNKVTTYVGLPSTEADIPGIEVHKSVEPYEFQIGDEIPYSITIKQNNPDATAMNVVVTDDTLPKGLNVKEGSIKVSGINRNYTAVRVTGGIQFKTWYLEYGETVTIDFIAIAEKNLNGQVIPNTVTAEAWGVPDKYDSTTIYLNSPKIDVDKKVSKQGEASVNNTINYEVTIRQINPGCFMREIWFEDEILTEGVELDKGSFSVSDTDGNLLALNTDYTLNIQDNRFIMQFAKNNMGYYDKEEGTGDGGGKYPVDSPYLPTWDDARGQTAKYYFKAADQAAADYENLDLQYEYIITYTATVDDSELAGREVENHAVVPATENTNGDVIKDDPDIPSGGGEDEVTVFVDGPNLIPDKESDKREYNVDEMAEYTLTVGLDGSDMAAEDVVITDRFQQEGIAVLSSDTIRVRFNNFDITGQCRITPDDDLQGFTIETGRDLTQKDRITVQYLAEITGDGVLDNIMRAEAANAPRVEWDNDVIVTPMPELRLAKTSDKEVYTIGETGTYKLKVNQIVPGAVAEKIVIDDSITEEGVFIDKESFKVMLNDDNITDKCIIKAEDRSFRIETRRNMTGTDEIIVTYDVLFTDDALPGKVYNVAYAVSDNTPEVEAEHEIELMEVPPELDIVKTSDKELYVLGEMAEYTVTATQTKEHAVARGVVLKDKFTYGGMQIVPDSFKVMKGDVDITKECSIDAAKRSFRIDTKQDLKYNDSITVTYLVQFNSIKVTEAQIGIPQPEQETTTGAEIDIITRPEVNILAGPEAELVDRADGYAHNIVTVDADNAPEEETEHIVSLREPELKIIKKADKKRYNVGDTGTYTLTVKQKVKRGIAANVVIKDKFKKTGMEIERSDIKVKKGKKDITKTCRITMNGKNGFTIRTGQDLAYGEEMTVTYKVLFKDEALKGKKLRNVAIARAKNADEVKTDEEVKIWGIGFIRLIDPDGNGPGGESRSGGRSGSGPATGDDSGMLIALCCLLMIISAGGMGSFWRRRFLEGREK